MSYAQYKGRSYIENNADMLNQYNWDLKLITKPAGVYYPGDQIFYSRLKQVSGLPSMTHSVTEVDGPAGFKILQPGDVEHSDASIQLSFLDYEDSSIYYLFTDWMNKIQDPATKIGLPKAYVICDIELTQLNTQLKPVLKWNFETGMPVGFSGYNTDFADKRQVQELLTVDMRFEWWKVTFLNATLAQVTS
jgi:hypothetical protein